MLGYSFWRIFVNLVLDKLSACIMFNCFYGLLWFLFLPLCFECLDDDLALMSSRIEKLNLSEADIFSNCRSE